MHFVTFHSTNEPCSAACGMGAPYSYVIPLFLASIRRSHPNARTVLLTDPDSELGEGFDEAFRFPVNHAELMLARIECQVAFLETLRVPTDIVFLDTDTLVIGPLEQVFTLDFDVGVTVREAARGLRDLSMPYNNGVVFARGCGRTPVATYLRRLAAIVRGMDPPLRAWRGNQLAVRQLLGRHRSGALLHLPHIGVTVRTFPGRQYNYAPACADDKQPDCRILHFEGQLKGLMPAFAMRLGETELTH